MESSPKLISIIIPCYNEEKNINRTIDALLEEEKKSRYPFEIIAVNDGSTDKTWEVLESYAKRFKNIIAINQMCNFGQSQAYQAGFDIAKGHYVLTCSADLETPLKYIHAVVEQLDDGYDFVNTNRNNRWKNERAIKSGIANFLIQKISGIRVKDRGSGMKGMVLPIAKNLKFYGEMHRFIPDYASVFGAKIMEIDTEFQDRDYGVSFYKGHKRTIKVLLDLVTLAFMLNFAKKPFIMMPGRLFGFTGGLLALIGFIINLYMTFEKLVRGVQIGQRPLLLLGVLLMLLGVVMLMFGMLGDLLMRIYFESTGKKTYMMRAIVGGDCSQKGISLYAFKS